MPHLLPDDSQLKENAAALERNAAMRRDVKSLRVNTKPTPEEAMARFVHAKAAYQTSVQQELGPYLHELDLHRQSKREMELLGAEIRRLKLENRIQAASRGEEDGIMTDIRVLAAAHVAQVEQEGREAMAFRAEELLTLKRSPPKQALSAKLKATTLKSKTRDTQGTNCSTLKPKPGTHGKGELLTSDYEDSQVLSDQRKKRSPSPLTPNTRKQSPSPPLSPPLTGLHSPLMSPWTQYNPYMPMGGGLMHPLMPMHVPVPVPVPMPMPYSMPPYGYPPPPHSGYPPPMYGPPPPSQAWPPSPQYAPQAPYPYPYHPPPHYPAPYPPQQAMSPPSAPYPYPADQAVYSAQAAPSSALIPASAPPPPVTAITPEAPPAPAPAPAPAPITPAPLVIEAALSSERSRTPPPRPPSLSGTASPPSFSRGPSLSGVLPASNSATDALKKSDELSLLALASRKKTSQGGGRVPVNPSVLPIISRAGSESDMGEPRESLDSPLVTEDKQPTISFITASDNAPSSPISLSPSRQNASSEAATENPPFQLMRNSSASGGGLPASSPPPSISRQRSISISGSQTPPLPGRISSSGGALPGVESYSPSSFSGLPPVRPAMLRIDVSDSGEGREKKDEMPQVLSPHSERSSPSGINNKVDLARSSSLSRSTSIDRKRTAFPSDPGSPPLLRSPSHSHGGEAPIEIKVSPSPLSPSHELDSEDLMRLGSTRLESKGIDSSMHYSRSTSQNTTTMATTVTQASTPAGYTDRSSDSRGLQQLQPELCPSPSEIPDSSTPGGGPLNRIKSMPEREKATRIMEEVEKVEEVPVVEEKEKEEVVAAPAALESSVVHHHQPIASIPEEEENENEEDKEDQSPFLSVTSAELALAAEKEAAAKALSVKDDKKMESEAMAQDMDAAAEALAKLASKPRPVARDLGSGAGGKPSKPPAMLMSLNLDIDDIPGPSSAAGSGATESKRTTRQSGDITASPGGLYKSSSIVRSQGSFTAGGSTFLSSGHGSSGAISLNQGGTFGRQSLNQSSSMRSIMSKAISKAADDFGEDDDELEFPTFRAHSQAQPPPKFEAVTGSSFSLGKGKGFTGSFSMSQSFNDDF